MLISFASKLVKGVIKKIIGLIVIIGLIIYAIFNGDVVSSLLDKTVDFFSTEVKVEMESDDLGHVEFTVNDKTKRQIDAWIEANNYNEYGDALDTVYAGGTPLFNESTGASIDRYQYLLNKHPELKVLLEQ